VGFGLRRRHLLQFENLGCAVPLHDDGLHESVAAVAITWGPQRVVSRRRTEGESSMFDDMRTSVP
jgi:hypothetical protein